MSFSLRQSISLNACIIIHYVILGRKVSWNVSSRPEPIFTDAGRARAAVFEGGMRTVSVKCQLSSR
jgi:hypothetical protein